MPIVLDETEVKHVKNGQKPYEIASIEIIDKCTATINTHSPYDTDIVKRLINFVIHGHLTQAVEKGEEYKPEFSTLEHKKNLLQLHIKGSLIPAFIILKKNSMSENLFNAACETVNSLENTYNKSNNLSRNNNAERYLTRSPSSNTSTVFFHTEEENKASDSSTQAIQTTLINIKNK